MLDAAHAGIERDLDAGALAGVEQARVGVLFRGAVRFATLFVFVVIVIIVVAGRGGARGGRGGAAGRRDGLLELGGSQTLLLLAAATREGRGDLLEGDDLDRALLAEVALVRRGAARAEAGGGVLGVLRPVCICAVGGARVVVGVCGAVEGGGAAHGGCGCGCGLGVGIGVEVHRVVVVWAVSVGGAEVWAGVRWEDEDGRAGAGGVVRVHPFLSGIEEEERGEEGYITGCRQ